VIDEAIMLNAQRNQLLTSIVPGTAMGAYLRRYWHPIAGASELDATPIKPIRLFGENLVLYKDLGGRYGLVDRHCPHRSADLSFGMVEDCGIRCAYHGWQFDRDGRCLQQPFEDTMRPNSRYKERLRIKAYPVVEKAGLLFAYMGSEPAPALPDWEPFSREDGFVEVVSADVPCNWFQCQENSIDPVHFEWMHANWSARMRAKGEGFGPTHTKLGFEEFDYGFVYKRVRSDTDETDPLWTVGRVLLWPNGFYLGNHFEWRVPVDDENTLSICWIYRAVPQGRRPYRQPTIPTWKSPVKDANGRWVTSHVINQDIALWASQGPITDRSREHLGQSDKGILMLRERLFAELDAVANGAQPKGLIPASAPNQRIPLPTANRVSLGNDAVARKFILLAGQPESVRQMCSAAMGFDIDSSGIL
jgi:5,5'-dehydrodivanillate O-demethylase oxygenase subunit